MRSYLILSIALFVAALVQPALSVPHQTNRTEILERYIQKTRIKQQWQRANPGVSVQKFERALRARQSAATCSPGRVSTITNGQLLCCDAANVYQVAGVATCCLTGPVDSLGACCAAGSVLVQISVLNPASRCCSANLVTVNLAGIRLCLV